MLRLGTWSPESVSGPRNKKPVVFSFGFPVPSPRDIKLPARAFGPPLLPGAPTCCPLITASFHHPQFAFHSSGLTRHTTLTLYHLLALGPQSRPSSTQGPQVRNGNQPWPADEGCLEHSVRGYTRSSAPCQAHGKLSVPVSHAHDRWPCDSFTS